MDSKVELFHKTNVDFYENILLKLRYLIGHTFSPMQLLLPLFFLLALVFFAFIWYRIGKDLNRLFSHWILKLKARHNFIVKGAHRSLSGVLAIYLSSLVTLVLYTYTFRHVVSKDNLAFVTDGYVFVWIVLCHTRTGIIFSERGNLLRVCTLKEQVINAVIWISLFGGIVYLVKGSIRYPATYYIVITLIAIIVTLVVMRFRNVKDEKFPNRAGLLKSKRVTFFKVVREDSF